MDIQTNRMRPMPIKLEAVNLKDYAQLDERYLMAKLTHRYRAPPAAVSHPPISIRHKRRLC